MNSFDWLGSRQNISPNNVLYAGLQQSAGYHRAYLANAQQNLYMAKPPKPPRFQPHQMTDQEVERFNRAGLLRRA